MDYRAATPSDRRLVETFHFTRKVEALVSGESGTIGGDLSYTLRAFPNHHRALLAIAKYSLKLKAPKPPNSAFSISCWFDRAMRFQPDDPLVRSVHGYYLSKIGDKEGAVREFRKAIELGVSDANTHYNLGLVLVDIGDYTNALAEAKLAYSMGFTLPGLRNKLKQLGKWEE